MPEDGSQTRSNPGAIRVWPLLVGLSPVPVMAGMLAGPSLSFLTEGQAMAAVAIGVAVGATLLWVLLDLMRSGDEEAEKLFPSGHAPARTLWLIGAVMVGGLGAVWFGQSVSDQGAFWSQHARVVVAAGIVGVGLTARCLVTALLRGRRRLVFGVLSIVLVAWGVVAAHTGWSTYPVTFDRALAFPCQFCRSPYLHPPDPGWVGFVNDVGLGLASMLVSLPWAATGSHPGSAQARKHVLAMAAGAGVLVAGLMFVGSQLGPMFYDPAWALTLGQSGWHAFVVLIAELGGTAMFLAVASATALAEGSVRRQGIGATLLMLLSALVALILFDKPVSTASFTNAEIGILALAYPVAPWAGAVAGRWLATRRRGGQPGPVSRLLLAWAVGFAVSLPGVRGWSRWDGGRVLHTLLPGIAGRPALSLTNGNWSIVPPQTVDWALAAGLTSAALVSMLLTAGPITFRRARTRQTHAPERPSS